MFRKQVNAKTVTVLTILILAIIQGIYWRLLVYREPPGPPGAMSGAGGMALQETTQGFEDVSVETVTGDLPGFQDGPAWQARFCGPNALAMDRGGTLYVTDSRNHRIRAISPAGVVTTIAGAGEPGGPGGEGNGPATEPRFRYPSGIAVAKDGTLYVADTGNHRVCRIRNGQVTTLVAAPLQLPATLTLDEAGMLWVSDLGAGVIRKIAPNGTIAIPKPTPPTILHALGEVRPAPAQPVVLSPPQGYGVPIPSKFFRERRSPGVRVGKWDLYTDPDNHVLMGDGPAGKSVLVAGRRMAGSRAAGAVDDNGGRASFAGPCALVVGSGNVVYVAEYEGNRIRRVRVPEWMLTGAVPPPRPPGGPPNGR